MHAKMNYLAPAGFTLSLISLGLTILSALCLLKILFTPVVGAILGIAALVASSVGLTMTGIARSEIVQNAQYGDEYAVSGMVISIVICAGALASIILYFVFY